MADPYRFPSHDAWRIEVCGTRHGAVQVTTWDGDDAVAAEVPAAALPALVAALAAHLPEDARRALTRELAAQNRDTVVMTAVALHVAEIAESTGERNTSIWSLRGAAQDSIARRRAADEAATNPPPGEEGQ